MKAEVILKSLPRVYTAEWQYSLISLSHITGPILHPQAPWQLYVTDALGGLVWESEWLFNKRYTWFPIGWQL